MKYPASAFIQRQLRQAGAKGLQERTEFEIDDSDFEKNLRDVRLLSTETDAMQRERAAVRTILNAYSKESKREAITPQEILADKTQLLLSELHQLLEDQQGLQESFRSASRQRDMLSIDLSEFDKWASSQALAFTETLGNLSSRFDSLRFRQNILFFLLTIIILLQIGAFLK